MAQIVGFIKGKSVIHIAQNYLGYQRNFIDQQFWVRGYQISTVGRDEHTVREYISPHEKEERHLEQLSLFR